MRKIAPSIENRLAEHHRGLPVWIRVTGSGQEYCTGLTRARLYDLAGRGLIRTCENSTTSGRDEVFALRRFLPLSILTLPEKSTFLCV